MFRLHLLLIVTLVWTSLPTEAAAEEPFVLNLGTVAPKNTPWGRQLKRIRKRIQSESEGRIKVKLFMGTAGGEVSIVRQAKRGELQAAAVSTGALASMVPEMNVFELPYLFADVSEADRMIDDHLFGPTRDLLREYGFELYAFAENGFRNFATKGVCIRKPADLATLKMRSQESWVHEETYRALGGNPVRIAVPEVLQSLESNNVQGFDNTPLFAFAASWHGPIDHWTVSDHIYQPAVIVYNKPWFDKLPSDLQQVLVRNGAEESKVGRKGVRKLHPKLVKNLEAAKISVCRLTADEKRVFAEKTKSVHQLFRKRVGKKGASLLDLVEKNR